MQGLQAANEGNYLTAAGNNHQATVCNSIALTIAFGLQIALFGGLFTFLTLFIKFGIYRD